MVKTHPSPRVAGMPSSYHLTVVTTSGSKQSWLIWFLAAYVLSSCLHWVQAPTTTTIKTVTPRLPTRPPPSTPRPSTPRPRPSTPRPTPPPPPPPPSTPRPPPSTPRPRPSTPHPTPPPPPSTPRPPPSTPRPRPSTPRPRPRPSTPRPSTPRPRPSTLPPPPPPSLPSRTSSEFPIISINIALDPETPKIGGHITFIPRGDTNTLSACSWFRGGDDHAKPIVTYSPPPLSKLAFKDGSTGREFLNSDCSLHIKNLTAEDAGFYKGVMEEDKEKKVGKVYLNIQGRTTGKAKQLSAGGIIGIAVSSFFVVSMFVVLTAYWMISSSRSSISQPVPATSVMAVASAPAAAPVPAPVPAPTQAAKKTTAPKRKAGRGGTAQRGKKVAGRGGARTAPRRGR